MSESLISFVRHVDLKDLHNRDRQAALARAKLEGMLVRAGAVVLASPTDRAMYTSRALTEGLPVPLYSSVRLELGGQTPDGIRNLDAFLAKALLEAGVQPSEEPPSIIAVTHEPLLRRVKGDRVDYGEVVPYEPGSWDNSLASPALEQALEHVIVQKIAQLPGAGNV